MKRTYISFVLLMLIVLCMGCATSYKAQPLSFKHPSSYPNAGHVEGAEIGAEAYIDKQQAHDAFGFDIRGAGMLPVRIVVDNQGESGLFIKPDQTFLQDGSGNLWPVLSEKFAYERVTKYAQTKQIFKDGAYSGVISGAAGAIVGAAIGIVTGENVLSTAGKGAAVGAASGAVLGGLGGYASADEANRLVMEDFEEKNLQHKSLPPNKLSYGFIFFPGEAQSANSLRLQLEVENTGKVYTLIFNL